jgi:predicted protein tyrosine phosphatase
MDERCDISIYYNIDPPSKDFLSKCDPGNTKVMVETRHHWNELPCQNCKRNFNGNTVTLRYDTRDELDDTTLERTLEIHNGDNLEWLKQVVLRAVGEKRLKEILEYMHVICIDMPEDRQRMQPTDRDWERVKDITVRVLTHKDICLLCLRMDAISVK